MPCAKQIFLLAILDMSAIGSASLSNTRSSPVNWTIYVAVNNEHKPLYKVPVIFPSPLRF